MYAGGVRGALGVEHASRWFARLADPQILIDRVAQARVIDELTRAGHDGARLIEAARDALVGAIHLGVALGALVALFAAWHARRVPPITLRRAAEPTVAVD
jgi:hypothetical protein